MRRELLKPLALAALGAAAGGGTAALVPLGRPPGAALIGLFGPHTALLALVARRPLDRAVRATAWSFTPLLLLWPLLLSVTVWDAANHWFVFHRCLGLR